MSASESVRPRIVGSDYTVEPLTMRCDYDLPWNRQSNQTACGRVIQNQVGAQNWRIVIEGILTRPQLVKLYQMRGEDTVTVVTEEFNAIEVAFDNLNVTRRDEDGEGDFENHQGILLHFQLQTKEDPSDEGEGLQFFNENTRGAVYSGE